MATSPQTRWGRWRVQRTILHLAKWLLGDDPEALEIRQRQIVLLMPIANPQAFFVTDRFGNASGIDPYTSAAGTLWDLKTLTFTGADKCLGTGG